MSDITQPYQLLPPLGDAEFTALRDDIEANGIRVPVDVDEAGQILDGHHRAQIASDLGIECPTRVVSGLTEDMKREHAIAVNSHRRMLSREQRRDLVVAELERDPSRSDRAIGRITGADHKTVGAIRRGGWGVPHPDVESSSTLEALTEDEAALLAEADRSIAEGLEAVDSAILFALSNGVDPMLIVGWLTRAKAKIVGPDYDGTDPAVTVMFDWRINHLIRRGADIARDLAGPAPDLHRLPLSAAEVDGLATALGGGA